MQNLVTKDNLRRLFAATFLIFLFAEWGSHGVAFAHASSDEGQAIYSNEGSHEDPCKTLIQCSDSRRQDGPFRKFGHDTTQYNAFFEGLFDGRRLIGLQNGPDLMFSKVSRLFRPKSPPFHPPELS